MAETPACSGDQAQKSGGSSQGANTQVPVVRTPVLLQRGADQFTPSAPPANPSDAPHSSATVQPRTEFEQMVADSVGRPLPLFGQSLFTQAPSTFSPVDWMQVPIDYILGPGDELQIKIWGQVEADLRVVVDRSGQIYIPQVGQITVAGIHYNELEAYLKREVSRVFKNFDLTATMGKLRSIQVIVVGDARFPGTYTISALSTLVNAIFASGGPAPQGSLRDIEVRRDGVTITHFDFYDLLIKGDKSKDVRLQPGDVIYIPHVGPLVAIAGSVNSPAIYEMKNTSTLNDLIESAGDLSNVADTSKITIDRFADQARKTLEFPLDTQSRALPLKDGDIVRVFSVVPRFEDTVTLRGNVANPGRYPWKAGMRISDLIPNAQALLTRRYWRDRAAIVNGRATEYPVASEVQANNRALQNQQSTSGIYPNEQRNGQTNGALPTSTMGQNAAGANSGVTGNNNIPPNGEINSANASDALAAQNAQGGYGNVPLGSGNQRQLNTQNTQTRTLTAEETSNPNLVRNVAENIRRYSPEINWDYAIIQRVNPEDLSSKLLWISPRKIILEHDEQANLELKPGDIITIFSQRDVSVPQASRSQYVIIEGEVRRPGVYKLEADETLRSVLQRAGGLTPDAYIYGAQLLRESARIKEQKSLDELVNTMEIQIRQSAVSVAASTSAGELPQLLAAQEAIIAQLHSARATGRVALPVKPLDRSMTDFPNILMEDNDRVSIPHTPSTVSVVGNVYNPGSFIFEPRNTAGAYLELAGKGKPNSDLHHAFVLRANGVVVAANNVNGAFVGTKFDRLRLYPGDQIVVPYKLPTGAFVRALRDWTQIASQLSVTGVVLATILP